MYQISFPFFFVSYRRFHVTCVFSFHSFPCFRATFAHARAFPDKVLAKIEHMTSLDLKLYNAAVKKYLEVGGDRQESYKTDTSRRVEVSAYRSGWSLSPTASAE